MDRNIKKINALFGRVRFKNKVLLMLFISNVWIPLRRKLLKNHKKLGIYQGNQDENCVAVEKEYNSYDLQHVDKLLPPFSSTIKFYFTLSSLTHFINSIVNTIFLSKGEDKLKKDGWISLVRCHSHRLVMHDLLTQDWVMIIGFALSSFLLVYKILVVVYKGELLLDPCLFLLIDKQELPKLSDPKMALEIYKRYSSLDSVRQMLFCKIEDVNDNRLEFVVKPGRSEKDHAVLYSLVDLVFSLAVSFTAFGLVVSIPIGIYVFATKLDFLYPNCDIQDYDLAYLNRLIGSMNLTLVFLFDCFISIFYPAMISVLVSYDLMVYWSGLETKLHELHKSLQLNLESHTTADNKPISTAYILSKYNRVLDNRQSNSIPDASILKYKELNRRVVELQALVADFFGQVQRANEFMSIGLRFSFGFWVGSNGMISFSGIRDANETSFYFTAFAQFVFIMVLLFLSYLILLLKKRTEPAYKLLCSLMAKDPTLEKDRWLVLLKYYTVRPKYAFTMMHSGIFSLGLFLKTLTYTFTFALFIEKYRSS